MLARPYGSVAAFGGLIIALDQASKLWVLSTINAQKSAIEVTSFLNIVLVWNKGISFGVLNRDSEWQPWVLAGAALAIVIGLLIWVRKLEGRWLVLSIALIVGGAIGNVIDRIRLGAVVDFVDFHVSGQHFATFNIADAAITVGVLILLADSLFSGEKMPK